MIIVHQTNVAAFSGGHIYWWPPQQMFLSRISVRDELIAQYSSLQRGVFSRVHGKVN